MAWFRRHGEDDPDQSPDGPFTPEPFDPTAFRAELESIIDRLLPHGVDEVTPHVLDRLIDRHTLVRLARLTKEWVRYRDQIMPDLIEARAELAYEEVLLAAERRSVALLEVAYQESARALIGTGELPSAMAAGPHPEGR